MANDKQGEFAVRFEMALEQADGALIPGVSAQSLTATCVVWIGRIPFLLRIIEGRIEECTRSIPLIHSSDFILRGSLEAWESLWSPTPPPGRHDLFALMKLGEMQLDGNMQIVFSHLQYIKDLISLPRKSTVVD